MRYSNARFALVCALLLSSSALLGNCSLASYSETRSFRDALDGRSMEDAISGPVDKDTSSYGDRTASTPGVASSSPASMQSPASSMMLTIPANGNLNNMIPQQQQQQVGDEQQQSQSAGSELERETSAMMSSDNEQQPQQLMEQNSKSARQRSVGRPKANSPVMRMMAAAAAAAGAMRSSRQQQQPEGGELASGSVKGSTGNSEVGFSDEPAVATSSVARQPAQTRYNARPNGNQQQRRPMSQDAQQEDDDQQQQQQAGAADQQVMGNNGDDQQQQLPERSGYASPMNGGATDDQQMAARQRATAAMLISMNNGMKYSRQASSPSSSGYGDKKASAMAQNMMASLASKAAYMGMQQQKQQQRQGAPPVMVSMIPTTGANSGGNNPMMNGYRGQMMPKSNVMLPMTGTMNGNGMRGGMRRANQRKVERKMSPAMVNAMLNKMLSMKQKEQEGGQYGQPMKPVAVDMLMRSPAGAEMLANMVLPQMSGAMADMSPAKKEQYKRMMVAAIMQQATAANGDADLSQRQQEPEKAPTYGSQQMIMTNSGSGKPASGAAKSGAERGYNGAPSGTATMSPLAMMLSMMAKGAAAKQNAPADYDEPSANDMQQRLLQASPMTSNGGMGMSSNGQYADRLGATAGKKGSSGSRQNGMKPATNSMSPADFDQMQNTEQQQQQQSMDGGYSNSDHQQREITPATMMSQQVAAPGGTKSTMGRAQPGAERAMSYGQTMMAPQPGMKMNGASKNMGAGNYAEQKRQMDANSGFGGNDADSDQQQMRELMPATMAPMANMMGSAKSASDSGNSYQSDAMPMTGRPAAPMNGFRQAYDQQQQQQRLSDGSAKSPRIGAPSNMGTKGGLDSYPAPSSMARPMPMQQSYGQQANSDGGSSDGQQLQDDNNNEYGAAPMGMAEPFAFDYKLEDDYGNGQYRKEESDKNGVVRGSYGYTDVSGLYRHVEYVADENGFRANIKSNEPGLSSESAPTNNNNGASNNNNRPSGNGGADSQAMSPITNNMDSANSSSDGANSNNNNPQQQLQQQLMIMMGIPNQTELNENGERK